MKKLTTLPSALKPNLETSSKISDPKILMRTWLAAVILPLLANTPAQAQSLQLAHGSDTQFFELLFLLMIFSIGAIGGGVLGYTIKDSQERETRAQTHAEKKALMWQRFSELPPETQVRSMIRWTTYGDESHGDFSVNDYFQDFTGTAEELLRKIHRIQSSRLNSPVRISFIQVGPGYL